MDFIPGNEFNLNQNNDLLNTQNTIRAFVDAVIPQTPELAQLYGSVQYYGALDLLVDEYMVMQLNYFEIPLAEPTARLLNAAANQMSNSTFVDLSPVDRLRVVSLIEQFQIDFSGLPEPFRTNRDLITSAISTLNSYTMMGFYSEWNGYGQTRLQPPNQRTLEYYPISWDQIDYLGPSLGYRALREYKFS